MLGTAFLRATATGMVGILLGVHLARIGLDAAAIGIVVGAGLSGAALATLVVTVGGVRIRPRLTLVALALLAAAGALLIALVDSVPALAFAAFIGMLNGMGRDRGASLALEQAALPSFVTDRQRTSAFAWYNLVQDAGHAIGSLAVAIAPIAAHVAGARETEGLRLTLALAALLFAAMIPLYLLLPRELDPPRNVRRTALLPSSRRILGRISGLFALDGLGGGFLTTALLSYFFFQRFGVGAGTIAILFFVARSLNGLSHLGAAWLARRFGLVNTMVFTHIPSSLLLVMMAIAPSFAAATVLFLLREGLVEMDVPTRQSYVMAVVRPEERTFASGLTNLVRMATWAIAPFAAGWLMREVGMGVPLVVGAVMKIAYDLLLWASFRGLRPPEEMPT